MANDRRFEYCDTPIRLASLMSVAPAGGLSSAKRTTRTQQVAGGRLASADMTCKSGQCLVRLFDSGDLSDDRTHRKPTSRAL